jgi:hypothetical protein
MAEDLYKIWLRDVVQRKLTGVELYQSKGPTIVTETSRCLKGLSGEILILLFYQVNSLGQNTTHL